MSHAVCSWSMELCKADIVFLEGIHGGNQRLFLIFLLVGQWLDAFQLLVEQLRQVLYGCWKDGGARMVAPSGE